MLWHPSDMEQRVRVWKLLSFIINYFQNSKKSTFMEPTLCLGKERDNLQSKGISKLIKAAQKQYASFLLALLSCKKDDSDLYWISQSTGYLQTHFTSVKLRMSFTTTWGKKKSHWTHADNRSEGINAREKSEQTATISIRDLAGIRYGFSLSNMIIYSY